MASRLIRNAVRCLACNDVIESHHRYDFVRCTCGSVAVDGGLEYAKRSFPLMPPEDHYEELSEYTEGDDANE